MSKAETSSGITAQRVYLMDAYQDKAQRGRKAILENKVIGHPFVVPDYHEKRYALSAVMFRFQGPVAELLSWSSAQLQAAEPTAHFIPTTDFHIDLNVLSLHQANRRTSGINARIACSQAQTLLANFAQPGQPIILELDKVVASADQENSNQTSITITALFLPINHRLSQVRHIIQTATIEPLISSSKPLNIVHASLARLTQPPTRTPNKIPLLETLDTINQRLAHLSTEARTLILTEFDLISTTCSASGFYAAEYVAIGHPISLIDGNNITVPIAFRQLKHTL